MAAWAIAFKGQDGRKVYVAAKRNGRGYKRKSVRAATTYTSQALANAAIVTLIGRHSEAVAEQLS